MPISPSSSGRSSMGLNLGFNGFSRIWARLLFEVEE
jgi:hypothetical protein